MFKVGEYHKQRLINLIIPLGMMTLFVLYQSWPIFTEPQFYSDDQRSNWLLALRQYDPSFLSHDYVFGNPLFQGHYIPVYLFMLHTLIRWLGGIDNAMIFLHSVMLLGYLITMFILLRYITNSNLVSALIAIASALSRNSIAQEIWAATDMRAVMPRTAFLVTTPLLCLLLFRWLPSKTWWRIPLLGFFIGLATNFHPPSGLFFLQITLTLLLLFSSTKTHPSFPNFTFQPSFSNSNLGTRVGTIFTKIALTCFGFIVGGLPTVWAVFRGILQSRQLTPSGTFQEFAAVFHWRMRTEFPFPPEQLNFVGQALTEKQQSALVILYLISIGTWLAVALWFNYRGLMKLKHRSNTLNWMLLCLLVLNIPLAYLTSTFLALDLILVAIAYWISKLIRRDYDLIDIWALTILVCAGAYSFIFSALLGWFWETFELWSLTSFFGEQARMSRFIYLPLYIFLARWFHLLLLKSRDKILAVTIVAGLLAGLTVRHWHFLDPWGPAEWGMAFCLIILAITGTWLRSSQKASLAASTYALVASLAATTYLWLYIVGVNLPWLGYLTVATALLAGLTRVGQHYPLLRWVGIVSTAGVLMFGLFFGPSLSKSDDPNFKASLRTQAMKALGLYDYGIPSDWPDSIAFYDWAKHNTAPDALFYFNDRQYEFRAFATRAVTHSWKDVGGGYYTPPLAIEYHRRFQKLEAAYQDPAQLLACAEMYGSDYIVAKDGQPLLELPIAYTNELYLVYAMDGSIKGDPALCQ